MLPSHLFVFFFTGLSEEIDVYHDWIDACEKVNRPESGGAATGGGGGGGGGGSANKRRRIEREDDDED
jgi:transcription elongation factor Elf1